MEGELSNGQRFIGRSGFVSGGIDGCSVSRHRNENGRDLVELPIVLRASRRTSVTASAHPSGRLSAAVWSGDGGPEDARELEGARDVRLPGFCARASACGCGAGEAGRARRSPGQPLVQRLLARRQPTARGEVVDEGKEVSRSRLRPSSGIPAIEVRPSTFGE